MPHLNVEISDEAYDRAKAGAAAQGMLLRKYVERLLMDGGPQVEGPSPKAVKAMIRASVAAAVPKPAKGKSPAAAVPKSITKVLSKLPQLGAK